MLPISIMERIRAVDVVDQEYLLEDGDIAYKDGNLYLALQRKNECNNLLVFGQSSPTGLIRSVLEFILILHCNHHIDYLSIYRQHRGWLILRRFKVLWENDKQGYAKISENMETINEILERYRR